MKLIDKMNQAVKKTLKSWLNIGESQAAMITIKESADYELNAIRNRIWYRGDSDELEQLYSQLQIGADRYKFWASRSSPGMGMRKIHTGLPGLIVKTLTSIVLTDINEFKFTNQEQKTLWEKIADENRFKKLLDKALREILCIGDGAFKMAFDTGISALPILEFYPGDRIEVVNCRGRLQEIIFKTPYQKGEQRYTLHEHYGYGYIYYSLYRDMDGRPADLDILDETRDLEPVSFDNSVMLAVFASIYESVKWEERGQSIFDGKIDNFDAFDEVWSQWMDALRAGRAKTYIPECLIPKSDRDGSLMRPNPFDNRFIKIDNDLSEAGENRIDVEQPVIPHDSYLASYITALDQCLQGIISPGTLGIDMKKLDNAEAQREKEKATLYTRDAIMEALHDLLPRIISASLNACSLLAGKSPEPVDVHIEFGEYANPSFESQIETIGKGRQQGILSIEAAVEELYGDTKNEEWKRCEVERLKAEQAIGREVKTDEGKSSQPIS